MSRIWEGPRVPHLPSQSLAHKVLWMSELVFPGKAQPVLGTNLPQSNVRGLGLASVTRENVVGATGACDFARNISMPLLKV